MTNIVSITEAPFIGDKAKRSERIKALLKESTATQKNEAYKILNGEQRFEEMFISCCETNEIQSVLVEIKKLRKAEKDKEAEKKAKKEIIIEQPKAEYIFDPVFNFINKNEIKLYVRIAQNEMEKTNPIFIEEFKKKPSVARVTKVIEDYIKIRNKERIKDGKELIYCSPYNLKIRIAAAFEDLDLLLEKEAQKPKVEEEPEVPAIPKIEPENFSIDVKTEAENIIRNGNLLTAVLNAVGKYHFGDEETKKYILLGHLVIFVPGERQRNTGLSGESMSGKSSAAKKTIHAFPVQQRILLSNVSEKALSYACKEDPFALLYKTIYIDESSPELQGALKSMTDCDSTDCMFMTVDSGKAIGIEVKKPFAVVVSSVQIFKEAEMRNRFTFPASEDDIEKKKEIDLKITRGAMSNALWSTASYTADRNYTVCRCAIEKLTNELRNLKPAIIEDIKLRAEVEEFVAILNRGELQDFISLCRAVAYLDPFNHQSTANNELLVTAADIEEAKKMWYKSTDKMGNVERWIMGILSREDEMIVEDGGRTSEVSYEYLTQRKIIDFIKLFYHQNINEGTVKRSLTKLMELGRIDHTNNDGGNHPGKAPKYFIVEGHVYKDDTEEEPEDVQPKENARKLKIDPN